MGAAAEIGRAAFNAFLTPAFEDVQKTLVKKTQLGSGVPQGLLNTEEPKFEEETLLVVVEDTQYDADDEILQVYYDVTGFSVGLDDFLFERLPDGTTSTYC